MKAVQDFNYKVALASGLKHLRAGKHRQAEEQFRYLVAKFPTADGGYRGLARVQLETGHTPEAVSTLREGAVALSKVNERTIAIDLLREATTLDPLDLSAHRRLAAALALAGDVSAAAQEYVRFSNAQLAAGDADRARSEAAYALETFGEIPALHGLARDLGVKLRTVRSDAGGADVASEASHLAPTLAPAGASDSEAPSPIAPADGASWREIAQPSSTSPAAAPETLHEDPFALEARAMAMIGARDPEAGKTALDATRALAAAGKVQAASDLLLQLIASGLSVHDAERELIGIAHRLGRSDLAAERERLLEEATRLG